MTYFIGGEGEQYQDMPHDIFFSGIDLLDKFVQNLNFLDCYHFLIFFSIRFSLIKNTSLDCMAMYIITNTQMYMYSSAYIFNQHALHLFLFFRNWRHSYVTLHMVLASSVCDQMKKIHLIQSPWMTAYN